MEINLTKLLENPLRVKLSDIAEGTTSCVPIEIDSQTTAGESPYSFKLEEE